MLRSKPYHLEGLDMGEQLSPETVRRLSEMVEEGAFSDLDAAVNLTLDHLEFLVEKAAVKRGIAAADASQFYEGTQEQLLGELKTKYTVK